MVLKVALFGVKEEKDEPLEDDLTEMLAENLKFDSESTDDELRVVELQRATRMKKKIVAKISSNIAVQNVQSGKLMIYL